MSPQRNPYCRFPAFTSAFAPLEQYIFALPSQIQAGWRSCLEPNCHMDFRVPSKWGLPSNLHERVAERFPIGVLAVWCMGCARHSTLARVTAKPLAFSFPLSLLLLLPLLQNIGGEQKRKPLPELRGAGILQPYAHADAGSRPD